VAHHRPSDTPRWRGRSCVTTSINGTTTSQVFDAFDRMVSDDDVDYSYDALDRATSHNGKTILYAGTEQEPVADGNQTFSRDPNGNLLGFQDGATAREIFTDAHQDVVSTFTATGTSLDAQIVYDPYGTTKEATGTLPDIGYQSSWTDPATQRVNMQARWYTTYRASFISSDTWDVPNKYNYANANPFAGVDRNGLFCPGCGIGGAATGAEVGGEAGLPADAFGPPGWLLDLGAAAAGGIIGGALGFFFGGSPAPSPSPSPAPSFIPGPIPGPVFTSCGYPESCWPTDFNNPENYCAVYPAVCYSPPGTTPSSSVPRGLPGSYPSVGPTGAGSPPALPAPPPLVRVPIHPAPHTPWDPTPTSADPGGGTRHPASQTPCRKRAPRTLYHRMCP
jgi:RHS repeat-associated protein